MASVLVTNLPSLSLNLIYLNSVLESLSNCFIFFIALDTSFSISKFLSFWKSAPLFLMTFVSLSFALITLSFGFSVSLVSSSSGTFISSSIKFDISSKTFLISLFSGSVCPVVIAFIGFFFLPTLFFLTSFCVFSSFTFALDNWFIS